MYGDCPDDTAWVGEQVWLSTGGSGETASRYYAKSECSAALCAIYLYQMTVCGAPTSEDRVCRKISWKDLFAQFRISRIGAILELDAYCVKYQERKKKVKVAMDRPPSDLAFPYFRFCEVVPVQDSSNYCIRAAVGNGLAVKGCMEVARRLWCHVLNY